MTEIKRFAFNPFQVNTYLLWDETKECAIVDPGCYEEEEKAALTGFIDEEGLKPVFLVNTHSHIDHIVGNKFISDTYGLAITAHGAGKRFAENAHQNAFIYGFSGVEFLPPQEPVKEGDKITFGNSELEVLDTPGHADGSICLVSHTDKFVIAGDVLFMQGIGRTDLPTGNYDLLLKNIKEKLFTLGNDYTVYPGHGPETTIGMEKNSNPFLMKL
jgi:glyoxylase-like metal-dependent hydrolase (beta-lactamase superfamily II)